MKHYNVVAAVVCHEGRFLCMQKGKTKFEYTSYKWEFPGGKMVKLLNRRWLVS
jgi:8-oxo-dGTP diphosphatase